MSSRSRSRILGTGERAAAEKPRAETRSHLEGGRNAMYCWPPHNHSIAHSTDDGDSTTNVSRGDGDGDT